MHASDRMRAMSIVCLGFSKRPLLKALLLATGALSSHFKKLFSLSTAVRQGTQVY